MFDEVDLALGPRSRSETVDAPVRNFIRIVDVEVIQEGEERPLRLPAPRQPVEEFAIDHRRRLAVPGVESHEQPLEKSGVDPLAQEFVDRRQALDRPVDQGGHLEGTVSAKK